MQNVHTSDKVNQQDVTLIKKVTQAVLKTLDDSAFPTNTERSKAPKILDGKSDSVITLTEKVSSNDEYVSNEAFACNSDDSTIAKAINMRESGYLSRSSTS